MTTPDLKHGISREHCDAINETFALSRRWQGFRLEDIDSHRNGVGGERVVMALFEAPESGPMVAMLFPYGLGNRETPERYPIVCGVLNRDRLAEGNIVFARNSWRGDHFADYLMAVLAVADKLGVQI